MRWKIIGIIAALIIGADQFTKYLVENSMRLSASWEITSFFNIVHVRNRGAAFGFLNNPDIKWPIFFFLALTLLALIIIFYLARKAEKSDCLLFSALGLISGGAVGNAIDRLHFGEVIDFLDIHIKGWHWPAFNIADIAICLGAGLMLIVFLNEAKNEKNKEKS